MKIQRLVQTVWCLLAGFGVLVIAPGSRAQSAPVSPLDVRLISDEADAVLSILAKQNSHEPITASDWKKLFSSEPYVRLKKREAGMHREFTDDDFRRFVLSADLARRAPELERTLESWKKADLNAATARALAYLPPGTRIRAKVYPVIKPMVNSFVFEVTGDAAIFLYLDPKKSQAEFDNTVAHELHHVGLASALASYEKIVEAAPKPLRSVLNWIGAFGEGEAVLAAAGSPDVHPMSAFPVEDRIRWDQDMTGFAQSLRMLDQFFLDILRGGFADDETANHVAFTFFGYRGPWYTVGYRMAVVVEKQFGRAALIECMQDPRRLLVRYNQAATELNRTASVALPVWSPALLDPIRNAVKAPAPKEN